MHKQLRVDPVASPPDVEKLLRRLADHGVNLGGAGGSNVEFGGEFAIAVEDNEEERARQALDADPPYRYRVLEWKVDPGLTVCWLKNEPGQLHKCIADIAAANLKSGRIIRDLLIGVPSKEGIPVQVYSEEVRTPQTVGRGSPKP
jgi:hypothetical protein